ERWAWRCEGPASGQQEAAVLNERLASGTAEPTRSAASALVAAFEFLQVVQRLVDGADGRAGDAALVVELSQQHEVLKVGRGLDLAPQLWRQLAGPQLVGVHVMLDEETRSVGDEAVQGAERRLDVVRPIEPLADV